MNIKTAEITGAALDWAVAKREGINIPTDALLRQVQGAPRSYSPTTDWAQAGPIIERDRIGVYPSDARPGLWVARTLCITHVYGPTPLIAAMRCYVASKLGDLMEVPDELCGSHTMPEVR